MGEKLKVDRIGYKSLDDLLFIIKAASRLKPVQEMQVLAGFVIVRSVVSTKPAEPPELRGPVPEGSEPDNEIPGPPLFPPPRLPSDDALEKLRASQSDWGFVRARTMAAAFLSAVVRLQGAGLEPTHLLTGEGGLKVFLGLMGIPTELITTKWTRFSGLEVIEHPILDEATFLVCGGLRVHGGVSDLQKAIRIDCQRAAPLEKPS